MKLLNEQYTYFPVIPFAVQCISNYDSGQNPTVFTTIPGGTPDFKWRGWLNEGKNQNPEKSLGLPTNPPKMPGTKISPPPPPHKKNVKFPSLKNFQKALKTWKSKNIRNWTIVFVSSPYHLIFTTQLNTGIENFKLKKILRQFLSLEIQSTPTVVTIQANSFQ